MHKVHPLAWQAPATDFAATHCMHCKAGWTRIASDGARITVCLLDRERILPNLTDCDRYEEKDHPTLRPHRP